MKKLRVYLLIISLAFWDSDLRRKESIPKSLNQMTEEESGLPIVNLHASHCAVMNLGLQFFFYIYLVVLEGLKNKIKDFLSPYDYR